MSEILAKKSIARLGNNTLQELDVMFMEALELKGFPDGYCTKISKNVETDTGLNYQEGYFEVDIPNDKGETLLPHAWNSDEQKVIADLTVLQFNHYLKKKLLPGVHIVHPEDEFYKRYHPLNKK